MPDSESKKPYLSLNGIKKTINNRYINSYFDFYGMHMSEKVSSFGSGITRIKENTGAFNRVSSSYHEIKIDEPIKKNIYSSFSIKNGIYNQNGDDSYYFERDCIISITLNSNMLANENILIPVIDRRSHGIGINLQHDFISLIGYEGNIDGEPSFTPIGQPYNFGNNINSKDKVKELIFEVIDNSKIRIYTSFSDEPIISEDLSGFIGSFYSKCKIYFNKQSINGSNKLGSLEIKRIS